MDSHPHEIGLRPYLALLGRLVEPILHARGGPNVGESGLVLAPNQRILLVVGNGGAPVADVDRALVLFDTARPPRPIDVGIIGPEPSAEAQRFLTDGEM